MDFRPTKTIIDGREFSANALTGNAEQTSDETVWITTGQIHDSEISHFRTRPARETIKEPVSQDWLFRHDMSADIAAEEREAEAFIKRMELTSLMDDNNSSFRISWGAERQFDDSSDERINDETL